MMGDGGHEPFPRSGLSKRTLYEFLRANSTSAPTAHPVHRTPWISKPRSQIPITFPSSRPDEPKTALQRLAQSIGSDVENCIRRAMLREETSDLRGKDSKIDIFNGKPPPMFENKTKERRALVVNHVKGTTPERIKKFKSLNAPVSSFHARRQPRKIVTLDDLHKAVLTIDFADLDGSTITDFDEDEPVIRYDSLDEYKNRQSSILLVETMEGLRQSLTQGYSSPNTSVTQGSLFTTLNVKIATAVRKGRDFCLLTVKRADEDSRVSNSSFTQGDVVLMIKPKSPLIDSILKYGFFSSNLVSIVSENSGVLFGIIERSKPSMVLGKASKSIQLRCLLASKDTPLGYSPSEAGTIGSEYVAIIIHSLLTVEREWDGLCNLKDNQWFIRSLLGNAVPKKSSEPSNQSRFFPSHAHDRWLLSLNRSQREAVETVTHNITQTSLPGLCRSISIIQGPPGTGKTHTLVSLLCCLRASGLKKVLVAAPSNAAVDELMSRFLETAKLGSSSMTVVRIGKHSTLESLRSFCLEDKVAQSQCTIEQSRFEAYKQQKDKLHADIASLNSEISTTDNTGKSDLIRTKERVKSQLENLKANEKTSLQVERDAIYKRFLDSAQFVFGTLSGFGSDQIVSNLDTKCVDVCLIDEAAQAIEVAALIPLRYNPNRMVLVGDPQQLPAVVKSVCAKRSGFDMSLMERMQLTGQFKTHMLREQYRMDAGIVEFPSKWFYEGQLQTASIVANRPALTLHASFSVQSGFVFIDVPGNGDIKQGTSLINPREARLSASLVRYLVNHCDITSIGVISPYRQQVNLIRSLLSGDNLPSSVEIDSVDAFQGREKDVIIFSCVRAGGTGDNSVGFLADQRRLNVAITRARRAVWLVGNAGYLAQHGGNVWEGLIGYCDGRKVIVSSDFVETSINNAPNRTISKPS